MFKLFRKQVTPKVFAIVLKGYNNGGYTMYMEHGYDLDEALQKATNKFKKDNKGEDSDLFLSESLDIEELANEYTDERMMMKNIKK